MFYKVIKILLIFAFIPFAFNFLFSSSNAFAKDIWYCPMHPHYTSDRPGLCPICNMSLVKKQGHPSAGHAMQEHLQASGKEGTEGHAPVSLTPQQMQWTGVKTAAVQRAPLVKKVRAAGYVSTVHELFEYQDQFIQAHIDYVTTYRDYKRFAHTRRNWDAHRALQVKIHETKDKLLRLGLGPMEIEKLEKVTWRNAWQQPELLLFKDDVPYWVVAQIFESDRGFLTAGQEVEVEIPAYHEQAKGVVRFIGGIFDSQTRTVNALIELQGHRGELEGDMFVHVTIPIELNESVMVPKEAVLDTGTRKIVYVQAKPGVFEPRDIEVVALGDNGWAVKSGLKEGEQVAVEGNFLLDSESRLQAAFAGASQGGHSHGN
ncbi:MAG: efflux RND transporter periplasmic adaptor subunit [Candidatus Omnitrophica bacterium]|nr:efflux RND transporter periplasmic adaptor subunit [Candidatus Omnitrophota bacterium]